MIVDLFYLFYIAVNSKPLTSSADNKSIEEIIS